MAARAPNTTASRRISIQVSLFTFVFPSFWSFSVFDLSSGVTFLVVQDEPGPGPTAGRTAPLADRQLQHDNTRKEAAFLRPLQESSPWSYSPKILFFSSLHTPTEIQTNRENFNYCFPSCFLMEFIYPLKNFLICSAVSMLFELSSGVSSLNCLMILSSVESHI